jgi:hypothetical protein
MNGLQVNAGPLKPGQSPIDAFPILTALAAPLLPHDLMPLWRTEFEIGCDCNLGVDPTVPLRAAI